MPEVCGSLVEVVVSEAVIVPWFTAGNGSKDYCKINRRIRLLSIVGVVYGRPLYDNTVLCICHPSRLTKLPS